MKVRAMPGFRVETEGKIMEIRQCSRLQMPCNVYDFPQSDSGHPS
jgi:hypothetical protein